MNPPRPGILSSETQLAAYIVYRLSELLKDAHQPQYVHLAAVAGIVLIGRHAMTSRTKLKLKHGPSWSLLGWVRDKWTSRNTSRPATSPPSTPSI